MSTYTTQLRYICEQYAGRTESADYKETPAVIAAALPKLFDFEFPLYDPAYKKTLETKIVHHYYFREIGAETAAQFKFMLARTLNEIMPYYNQLYKTADLEFNPFYDVDYYKEHEGSDHASKLKTETGSGHSSESQNGTTSDTTNFTGTVETETNGKRNTTIESETTRTANTTDTRTLNTEDQTTFNTTDQRTLNTTDTKTLNTKDTVRQSDTPQGALTGIEANTYLSSATITDKTGTETLGRSGTDTGHKTGTETTAHTGTDTLRRTGTDTTEAEETQNATESSTSTQESESTTTGSGTSSNRKEGSTSSNTSGSENINGTDQYLDHVYGKMGGATYAALLQEYRETLINIDMMVINELELCFMNIY